MALFKYILDLKRAALDHLRDRRKARRFPVAAGFPLKATLNLAGGEVAGRRTWAGSVHNMSCVGLNVQLPPAAVAQRGEATTVILAFDGHELRLPCVIAYYRQLAAGASCGLSLELEDPDQRKAYLQLLEAVSLGADLAPVKLSKKPVHPRDFKAEQYQSGRKVRLTAWRDFGDEIDSFELVLDDYCLRGEAKRPDLEVFSRKSKSDKRAWSMPRYGLAEGVEIPEVRQLFRWVALNLPRTVPSDVRQLTRFFTNARTDWKPPPLKVPTRSGGTAPLGSRGLARGKTKAP